MHQEFSICELDPGGTVGAHIHTFEESIYILEGELLCQTGDGTYALVPGDYGVIQVSAPHMGRIEDAHMIVCHMIGYYFMEQPAAK